MIVDSIENASMYLGINDNLDKAIKFITETDFSAMNTPSKYIIDGENVYASINEFQLKDISSAKAEMHNKYGDIHLVVEGEECIGWAKCDDLLCGEYDEKKDYALLDGEVSLLKLTPKSFMIVFPQDAHMPLIAGLKDKKVKKVIVKFRI